MLPSTAKQAAGAVLDAENRRVRALVNRNQRYRARTTRDVVHRMGQPVHGDTDKQVRIDKAPEAMTPEGRPCAGGSRLMCASSTVLAVTRPVLSRGAYRA